MTPQTVVDTSKPNSARIYDYLLGGQHNFEPDRLAAQQAMKILPWVKQLANLQRRCLQGLSEELTHKRGYEVVIDFGSGLPTQDHIHTFVPPGTTVIYSDHDPQTVAYAREILGSTPNVYYFQCNAARPEELLNNPEVLKIIGDRRNVALVYWGLASYLNDDAIMHAAQVLAEWSGPKACWVFNAQVADVNINDHRIQEIMELWKKMGTPLHLHTLKRLDQLLQPWYPDVLGYTSLMEWHNLPRDYLSETDRMTIGISGGGYGVYLIK